MPCSHRRSTLHRVRRTRFSWRRVVVVVAGAAVAVLVPLAVLGWASSSTDGGPAAPVATEPSTMAPSTTTTAAGAAPADRFAADTGVLRDADAADPFVAMEAGRPWLFTTNNAVGNVPVATGRADDRLVVADALPVLPAWASEGRTWAPAVTRTDAGWVLAFTAHDRASGRQCIGVATSPTVGGPYTPEPVPLVCHPEVGGSIDPSFVSDGTGRRWLLYKDDGNCCALPTTRRAVPLAPSAIALAGRPAALVTADLPWEDGLVEAPTMAEVGGRWLLLYSANRWDTEGYAVGAAWCDAPTGPCEKQPEPVLSAGGGLAGPGGVEFASGTAVGGAVVTFHAWPAGAVGYDDGSTRRLHIGRVGVTAQTVTITPRRPGRR